MLGFYHRGAFWRATIPKRGVAEVIGQRLNFSKPKRAKDGTSRPSLFFLNHVQARLKMAPESAVRLFPPDAGSSAPAHEIVDFCYSVEAVGPHGRIWNLSDALLGNLAIVHRFLSLEDVAFERIVRERRTILQSPPLPLDPEVRDAVLREAIRESHTTGLTKPYFMFRLPFTATNCTSEPLKLLDGVLRTPPGPRFFHRLPIHPRGYLKIRGLWQEGRAVPTLNDEMVEWLAGDEARQRRRIHLENKQQGKASGAAPKLTWRKNLSSLLRAIGIRSR